MTTEIAYAGENTLDALARVIKMAIAEAAFPDNPGEIVFGTDKHDELKNRDLADQHPIGAITGLAEALDGISINARAINTLREGNLIDHNAIRSSIANLADDVGALSGIPEDVEKLKMEVSGDISKVNEAIQKNAEDIKALQEAGPTGGSDNVALGTIYVSEWLENGDPPTVGTPVNVGLGSFVGAKPEHNTIYYAVIRRGGDVYFCSVRYKLTGETSSVTPTSVVKIGGSDSPVVKDTNPTFVGWATTYVSGTSEGFYVPYSRVSNRPDTGDTGLIIAIDMNGNGTWIVYGLCAGDVGDDTFAMQTITEVRVDKPEATLPTFGNLILNTSFTTPPITGEVYSIPAADFNREPTEAITVSGIVRFDDDTYYVEGSADPLPEEPDRGPVAIFNKVVKMTANMLFFIENFASAPTAGRAYNIPEDRFTRRPQRSGFCIGIAIVDRIMYLCDCKVQYNPNMLPQYNPAPTITVNTVKRLSAPDTIPWDKITGKPDFSTVYRYKGSVLTTDGLPENAEVGDVYNTVSSGMNYAWTGEEWDALGGIADLTVVSIPSGFIGIWYGAANTIPDGWALCDGTNGTPDLRDKFVLGAGTSHAVGSSGGSEKVKLSLEQIPSHAHQNQGNRVSGSDTWTALNGVEKPENETVEVVRNLVWSGPINTGAAGSSQPHPNMPPYYALYYIMKL